MKPSERAAIEAFAVGSILTGLVAWFLLPGAAWWVHLIIWLSVSGGIYRGRVEMLAHESVIDSKRA